MVIFDVKNGGISARLIELLKPKDIQEVKRLYIDPPYSCPEKEKGETNEFMRRWA